nr:GatB/YqeY domain-containing protein [Anaerolineaceae bacterium]
KDMGKVLKVLIPKLAGRATNQDASRVVKDCLTNRS